MTRNAALNLSASTLSDSLTAIYNSADECPCRCEGFPVFVLWGLARLDLPRRGNRSDKVIRSDRTAGGTAPEWKVYAMVVRHRYVTVVSTDSLDDWGEQRSFAPGTVVTVEEADILSGVAHSYRS